jgi:oligopeptide transport system permease protein
VTDTDQRLDFSPANQQEERDKITRPSLSYWEDAWIRLKQNKRAIVSLFLIVGLLVFTIIGPAVWNADPASQDLDQISQPPGVDRTATIVAEYEPWVGVAGENIDSLQVIGDATTQAVKIAWAPLENSYGYRVYRNLFPVGPEFAFGMPIGEYFDTSVNSHEDRLDVRSRNYFYSLVALDENGGLTRNFETIEVNVQRVTTVSDAIDQGIASTDNPLEIGDSVRLSLHPLGTDYLGRDMLARLMEGARVSLFIGIGAPLLFVLFGVVFGSVAGFIGGGVDQFMMRFADFVVALPFLLFMILFKIAFGIGPGESGVLPMLVALVVLMWPATARLVRGQIVQIREQGYIEASQLLGAKTPYLVIRHMLPNTLGVVLVTLTFEIPRVIFVEAFLSFIGMGVAPPTPSWGSMSNEGIKTMLTTPHELIFPALFISITVLAFNLLGDGLRDALDARMRNQE